MTTYITGSLDRGLRLSSGLRPNSEPGKRQALYSKRSDGLVQLECVGCSIRVEDFSADEAVAEWNAHQHEAQRGT